MTDNREQPPGAPSGRIPGPDDPAVFVDRPERDPGRGRWIYVGSALLIMIVVWWGL